VIPPETTETIALSVPLILPDGTDAVTCVALTAVTVKGEPFQLRVESGRKPVPKTVIARVEPAPGDRVQPVTTGKTGVPSCPRTTHVSPRRRTSALARHDRIGTRQLYP